MRSNTNRGLKITQDRNQLDFSQYKSINPSICIHKILLKDDVKLEREPQRKLNPTMKEVVMKEILKLLDEETIYPISDNK